MLTITYIILSVCLSAFVEGLVTACCEDGSVETEVAFYNFRFLQGVGLALSYASSSLFCVTVRIYVIISLLVLAVVLYVVAEYRLRQNHAHTSGHVTDIERRRNSLCGQRVQ